MKQTLMSTTGRILQMTKIQLPDIIQELNLKILYIAVGIQFNILCANFQNIVTIFLISIPLNIPFVNLIFKTVIYLCLSGK